MTTCHKVAWENWKCNTCECQHQVLKLFHIIVYIGIVLTNYETLYIYETLDLNRVVVSKQPSITYHVRENVIVPTKRVTWQQHVLASHLSSNPHKHITVMLRPCTSVQSAYVEEIIRLAPTTSVEELYTMIQEELD